MIVRANHVLERSAAKRSLFISRHYPGICLEMLRKTIPVEVRDGHLPNECQKCHPRNNLLDSGDHTKHTDWQNCKHLLMWIRGAHPW